MCRDLSGGEILFRQVEKKMLEIEGIWYRLATVKREIGFVQKIDEPSRRVALNAILYLNCNFKIPTYD